MYLFVAVLYSGTFCFLRSGIRKSVQWYNGMSIVYNLELNFNQNRLLKVMRCENLENFTIFYHYWPQEVEIDFQTTNYTFLDPENSDQDHTFFLEFSKFKADTWVPWLKMFQMIRHNLQFLLGKAKKFLFFCDNSQYLPWCNYHL
jgi:hypothetical protein